VTRTFLDANVLIMAFRGTDQVADKARAVLNDTDREFVASDVLRLELVPKAHFNKQALEEQFYEAYLASTVALVETTPQLVRAAEAEAKAAGLSAADALHVTAARMAGVDEFVTGEKSTKPLFRAAALTITSLHP
jgi:predicted nucleic acid-binding protein